MAPFPNYECARVLGDTAAAPAWLERADEKGLHWPANRAPDPELASLQDDPPCQELLKRMRQG
ncbi:MAG: hypothetical protein ACYSX0_03795 [Planctomycetota bacterium]